MLHRKIGLNVFVILLVLLVSASALAASPLIQRAPIINETVIWQLTDVQVVNRGQTVMIPEGRLTTGYAVEATATSQEGSLVPEGKFQLTLTAFSPRRDMPGQRAGRWYIQGDWVITDVNASEEEANARHSPAIVKGALLADLTFNPATDPDAFTAWTQLPMSPAGGRWRKGEGTFSVNERFEGDLFLALERWPENQ
jgi:hypothetical protein